MLAVLSADVGGTGAAAQVMRLTDEHVVVAPDPPSLSLMRSLNLRRGDKIFDAWTGACIKRAALFLADRYGHCWRSEALTHSARIVLAKADRLTRDELWNFPLWYVANSGGLADILGCSFPSPSFANTSSGPFDQAGNHF